MGEVHKFYPRNAADKADNVLEQAIGIYDQVLILGLDAAGDFAPPSSTSALTEAEMLWLMETFKHKLLSGDYQEG